MRKQMQMVFQDPYSSLNPRMTVEDIIGEPLDVHKLYQSKGERRDKILHLMELVGLNAEHATRYAHEFSGGQRQRIGIARALATNPRFIVCDEAVSALDVSIQAQVINMFEELQEKLGVAYLFIAHDLLVVHHISDRIAVMYLGRIVEIRGFQRVKRQSDSSLYAVAVERRSLSGSQDGKAAPAYRTGRGCAQPPAHAQRLRIPYPLQICYGTLRKRVPDADGPGQRTPGGLLEQISGLKFFV